MSTKAERIQLKECAAHNTMFIAENPHTLVTDAWGYEKLPTPLFHRIKEIPVGFFAECGWIDKDDQKLMIFERSFIYLQTINSVIIIDSFTGQKETEITSTYNLVPTLNCQKKANQFNLTTNSHKYKFYIASDQTLNVGDYFAFQPASVGIITEQVNTASKTLSHVQFPDEFIWLYTPSIEKLIYG